MPPMIIWNSEILIRISVQLLLTIPIQKLSIHFDLMVYCLPLVNRWEGLSAGSSSIVQLDAWNWEDAAYGMDNGIHFNMPGLLNTPNPFANITTQTPQVDVIKTSLDRIELVKNFFREAKSYHAQAKHESVNLKYESVKGLFNRKQKLFVHCDLVKEILVAIDFAREFAFDVVIVGGSESYQVADILKKFNIPVILNQMHALPTSEDDDFDQPYKTPAALKKAGVLFAINDADGQTRGRNLMYNAGTAVAYGLTKEEALRAITLDAATILGVGSKTGSLEVGKDANIIISDGDILDMRSSRVTNAFIQGRTITLDDKQKQLNQRYRTKYGLEQIIDFSKSPDSGQFSGPCNKICFSENALYLLG